MFNEVLVFRVLSNRIFAARLFCTSKYYSTDIIQYFDVGKYEKIYIRIISTRIIDA